MTDEIRTPAETARQSYRKMRRNPGMRKLAREDIPEYIWLRSMRNMTHSWRNRRKDDFMDRIPDAIAEAQTWVDKHDAWIEWFKTQIPTEEKFTTAHGPLEVVEIGSGATRDNNDVYASHLRIHRRFVSMVEEKVDAIRDQIELHDADDDDFGIYDEVVAAAEEVGLAPHVEYNDRDDGLIWFVDRDDPDNENVYYFNLTNLHNSRYPYKVTLKVAPRAYPVNNWKNYQYADLSMTVLGVQHVPTSNPLRCFRDYFGMFDSIRGYVDMEASPIPME